ncbi:MAG: type II toxin-antitoxin system YhaV family toxin [Gemmatimonadaceae bacterium]
MQSTPPIEVNGWKLYTWAAFRDRWDGLVAVVEELRRKDPTGYKRHRMTRFLAILRKVVMEEVPRDPRDARYRQGKTLGSEYAYWRRAKFSGRFRLFFRYHSGAGIIVYVWLNDEDTLRKVGSRTDVYATFRAMLENERPPSEWDNLIAARETWPDQGR